MPEPLVTVQGASVTFRGIRAIDRLDLAIEEGVHTVIRGGNGAGKSTLLRLLRGEQWPDRNGGSIVWHTPDGVSDSPLAGRALGALVSAAQQERVLAQSWAMSGEDMILGGLTEARYVLRRADDREHALILGLARELGIETLLTKSVRGCSQGELRLILIARALVRRPKILFLDEIADGLDTAARGRLNGILAETAKVRTLVVCTHRPETLPPVMRRMICLDKGRVVLDTALPHDDAATPVSSPVGAPADAAVAAPSAAAPSATIEIQNATVYIDRTPILHNITWTLAPGQNWAVLGDNGAGKSTLMRLVMGDLVPAYGGSIRRVLARNGGETSLLWQIRKGIRLVSDLLQATYTYNIPGEAFVISGIGNSVGLYAEPTPAERRLAKEALRMLGVPHLADRPIRQCSTGEMRRLMIARAIAGEPDLIILDEPCSGLDPAAREHLASLIGAIVRQGVQIIMVTHRISEIPPQTTHLLRLRDGRIESAGPCAG